MSDRFSEPHGTASALAALDGMLVVELGNRIGAGACGSLLAQLGATVVLVERHMADSKDSKWDYRAQFAAGKLSLLDAGCTDRALLRELIATADVVVVSSDWNCDEDDLVDVVSPHAVLCDITAYGCNSTDGTRGDSEWRVQAKAGIVATTGMGDEPPMVVPFPLLELMTGGYAAAAILAATRVSDITGQGQRIDMALYDCAFASLATFLPRVLTGESGSIHRMGNRHTMISPWNVYRAPDGWVLICAASDAQWQRLCEIMQRPELRDDPRTSRPADRVRNAAFVDDTVQSWVGARPLEESVSRLTQAQIAGGPVVVIDGYPREANLEHREMVRSVMDPTTGKEVFIPGSPVRMSASPAQAAVRIPALDADRGAVSNLVRNRAKTARRQLRSATAVRPLDGLRVIEIGHYTTVPLSTRLLASLGAEVVKIEPPEGEATRAWPPAHDGQGYFFTFMNSDKRSLVLDLREEGDAELLRDLIRGADMLVENLKPGALARRGFSAEALSELNPRLIYCSVSGFGIESLYAGRPAFDSVIQAMSGVMDILRAGETPVKTGVSCADLMGAEMAVLALLAALLHRDRTGKGQCIDLSMQDITAWLTQTAWNEAMDVTRFTGVTCQDGSVIAEDFAASISALEPELASVDRREACRRLKALGIESEPVSTVEEMVASPLTEKRELWFKATADGAQWPLLANPMRLLGTPPQVRKPMPSLGHDDHDIRTELAEGRYRSASGH